MMGRLVLSATWQAIIALPPPSAASTDVFVAPGALRRVEPEGGWRVRRAGALLAARGFGELEAAAGFRVGAVRPAGLETRTAVELGTRAPSAERLAELVDLTAELVETLLELLT